MTVLSGGKYVYQKREIVITEFKDKVESRIHEADESSLVSLPCKREE